MPCYHPITAWRSKMINPKTGKSGLVFKAALSAGPETQLEIACGQCIGCRLERSRQWALRCMHEASLYEKNCYITLTFNDEALEKRKNKWSVDVRDFQLFMKNLRFHYLTKGNPYDKKTDQDLYDKWLYDHRIRYFHCGEYGEICKFCMQSEKYCTCKEKSRGLWKDRVRPGRPHYHACLFNFDFDDRQLFRIDHGGYRHYVSESLKELWPHGYHDIGDVTFQSAAYVARYIMKKVNGEQKEEHYQTIDYLTGEFSELKPEYTSMSRRPGIGSDWFDKYKSDVYPKDFITHDGKKMRPPKFYDRKLEESDPFLLQDMKTARREVGLKHADNNTSDRLETRERIQQRKLDKLLRPLQ